jgi:hypothetical protein
MKKMVQGTKSAARNSGLSKKHHINFQAFHSVRNSFFKKRTIRLLIKGMYLIVGFSGMVATLLILIRVLGYENLQELNIILTFGSACAALAVMQAGFSGFRQLIRNEADEDYAYKSNSASTNKGAA